MAYSILFSVLLASLAVPASSQLLPQIKQPSETAQAMFSASLDMMSQDTAQHYMKGAVTADSGFLQYLIEVISAMAPDFLAFLIAAAFVRTLGSALQVSKPEHKLAKKSAEAENLDDAVDAFGCSRLHLAAHNACLEELRELLRQGANPNARDSWHETPLHLAARTGCADACEALLTAGADPEVQNKDKKTALMVAALAGHDEVCDVLLECASSAPEDADDAESESLDLFGCTELQKAAHNGSAAEVQILLCEGANPNVQDPWHETALHMAAREGSAECCALLLAAGSDPELQNKDKKTAFMLAALAGHARVCQLLLKGSRVSTPVPEVDVKDEFGCTDLHLAAHSASVADVEELLLDGADPNVHDSWGETPLHFAARSGSPEACALLLGAGSDMGAKNKAGKTALEVADFADHKAVCKLLLKYVIHKSIHKPISPDEEGELLPDELS